MLPIICHGQKLRSQMRPDALPGDTSCQHKLEVEIFLTSNLQQVRTCYLDGSLDRKVLFRMIPLFQCHMTHPPCAQHACCHGYFVERGAGSLVFVACGGSQLEALPDVVTASAITKSNQPVAARKASAAGCPKAKEAEAHGPALIFFLYAGAAVKDKSSYGRKFFSFLMANSKGSTEYAYEADDTIHGRVDATKGIPEYQHFVDKFFKTERTWMGVESSEG
ncbi:hypothetical protein AK812_SmicGene3597 [Symbiodinium microadriaticum]|uniref:Uncharacterized protein n=1 Tax=Symbiodinium microadriaticum TaxID=2951 RepID=A0A1Q9EYQ6_SYMMI|nr:hypothetical protein AK812_SmicGene3597 [Symbiodinium microadriaticum]